MRTTIIDGNNLIHKVPDLKKVFIKDKEAAIISLTEIVKSRINLSEKVLFVFDGHGKFKRKDVAFSGNLTADDVIRKKIEENKSPAMLRIVSSDTGITNFAGVCGCKVQKSEDFWKEINKISSGPAGKNINQNYIYDKIEKPDRMSRKEIDEFKKYFS